jgi:hypothetical protein
MARNAPPRRPGPPARPGARRPPSRPPDRRPPARRRIEIEPLEENDEELLAGFRLPSETKVALTRQELRRRRDRFVVFVLTPAVLLVTVLGVLVAGSQLYPDRSAAAAPTAAAKPSAARTGPAATATALAAEEANDQPLPEETIVAEPPDPLKLSAGVVDRPPALQWPEIADLKFVAEPSRPYEQADYTPLLSATELRRLIEVMSVNLTLHSDPALAQAAAGELAKSYPLRRSRQRVTGSTATLGYIPDNSGVGLVFTVGNYRVQIETLAGAGPIRPGQRAEIEYQTLHLGDHIARRLQEVAGQRRSAIDAATLHWRDHISRSLPFGR